MGKRVSHKAYVNFPFRYTNGNGKKDFPNKLGYICIGANRDGEHIFLTISGSACSVQDDFEKWKGIAIAKSRVDSSRPSVRKVETALDEAKNLNIGDVIRNTLKLRPTCEYMDEETAEATNKKWDAFREQEAQERFLEAIANIVERV